MPSIGGIDTSCTKDRGSDNVTTLISVELEGTKSLSSLKSQTIITPLKDISIKIEATTMAPLKNGEVDSNCKTSTQAMSDPLAKQIQPDELPDAPAAEIEGVVEKNGQKREVQVEENGAGDVKDAEGEQENDDAVDKSAKEKREEYKDRPRASSLEMLGLKKTKHPFIPNQGYLDPKICESTESELRRRKSSPSSYNFMRSQKIPEETEDDSVEKLAGEVKKMEVSGGKKGFGERMVEEREKETDDLVSKGIYPPNRQTNRRSQPYPTPQTGYLYAPQTSPVFNPMMLAQPTQYQNNKQYIKPPSSRVAVPGSTQQKHFEVRRMDNVIHQQMPMPRREPEEQSWPQSPTDNSYPNSPGSVASLSPAHTMQQMPSPAYSTQTLPSPGYSPQYSPSMQQHSPQSMMSPAESYQGMPVSPNSPHSPEMMNTIPSPPSVQSEDSGISSPPHNQNHRNYMPVSTRVGTNVGTVIDNSTPRLPESTINIEYLVQQDRQLSQHYQQQQQQQQHQHNQNHVQKQHLSREDQQKIQKIADDLKSIETSCNPPERIAFPPLQRQVNLNQGMMMRQHPVAYPGQQVPMMPNQMQMGTMHGVYLQEEESQINIARSMRFDDLCSPDEDGDTALHIAVTQARTKLVEVIVSRLLAGGRKDALNQKDNLGQTPLYLAMVTNQPEMIVSLVKSGADLMIPNKDQITLLHYAASKGYSQALHVILYCYFENMVPQLDIDVQDRDGRSPLQCAVRAHGRLTRVYDGTKAKEVDKLVDSLDTIRRLLQLGADPSFQDPKSGYTSLHYAVELPPSNNVTSNTHIIKIILEAQGVDARTLLKLSNYAGNTPLHVIAGRDYDEDYVVRVIDHLISFGADIDVKNLERQTPRDLVTQKKSERPRVYSRLQGDHLQGR